MRRGPKERLLYECWVDPKTGNHVYSKHEHIAYEVSIRFPSSNPTEEVKAMGEAKMKETATQLDLLDRLEYEKRFDLLYEPPSDISQTTVQSWRQDERKHSPLPVMELMSTICTGEPRLGYEVHHVADLDFRRKIWGMGPRILLVPGQDLKSIDTQGGTMCLRLDVPTSSTCTEPRTEAEHNAKNEELARPTGFSRKTRL